MAPKPTPPAAAAGSTLDKMPPIAKVGVGFLFAFLIGVLYFVVFYSDVDTDLTNAKRSEKGLRAQLAEAEKSREEYQKDADEKTRREQQAREQKKILPDDPEMPAFLATIQDVATVSGVNLTAWSPTEQIPDEFYAKVPMKLTLVGKFHQVVKFFHGVGQQDRIINIEDIRIKKEKPEADEVNVECRATAFRSTRPGEMKKKK
ncbi:Type IV pilus biogenesis protein PilO [Minicystis rosea]|nr:Type IV pilus biogenesis protein PilO [Minicystis rosea]